MLIFVRNNLKITPLYAQVGSTGFKKKKKPAVMPAGTLNQERFYQQGLVNY